MEIKQRAEQAENIWQEIFPTLIMEMMNNTAT